MNHGTKGAKGLPSKGFTIVELMIVVAILSILVSLAVPAYTDYTIRAKVSEGLSIASGAKTAVGETCQTDPRVVPTNSSVGWSMTASEYVRSITILNTCSRPWIVIRTRNTGATTDVVLSLDGYLDSNTGRVSWNCHQVRGLRKHMPDTCRDNHR